MEIHSNSLLIGLLLTCSIPLMLISLIALAIFTTRSREREAKLIRNNLQKDEISKFLRDDKSNIIFRLLYGFGLVFSLGLLITFLFLLYGFFSSLNIKAWVILTLIATIVCSLLFGILVLFLGYEVVFKKKYK